MEGQLSPAIERKNALFGYGAATICIFCIAFSAAAVQAMERAVPDLLLATFRFITETVGVSLILLLKGQFPPVYEAHQVPYLLGITASTSVFNLGLFAGAGLLPLVDTIGIANTAAMIFIAVVHFVSKKRIGCVKIFAILVVVLGIFMMMQPGWIFGKGDSGNWPTGNCSQPLLSNNSTMNISLATNTSIDGCPKTTMGLQGNVIGVLCTVFSGILLGTTYFLLNDYLKEVNYLDIAFFYGVCGTIVSFSASLYMENITMKMTQAKWGLLVVHCVCASVDAAMTFYAVSLIGSIKSSIVFNLAVLIFMCLQYTLMTSYIPGHRNWLEVMGAFLNCFGALIPPAIDLITLTVYSNPSLNDFPTD